MHVRFAASALLIAACSAPSSDSDAGRPPNVGSGPFPIRPLPPELILEATPPVSGARIALTARGAVAGETVEFVGSLNGAGAGPCPPALGGDCLDIVGPIVRMGSAVADSSGVAELARTLPDSMSDGTGLAFQALAVRGAGGVDSVGSPAVVGLAGPGVLPSLAGNHVDAWGTWHHVNARLWEDSWGNAFHVTDAGEVGGGGWLVGQNGRDNAWNPGLWSRFDWVWSGAGAWYCQTVYDGGSRTAALDASPPDASDPAAGGCGGFAWTWLDPDPLEIVGMYTDEWGTGHMVSEEAWSDSWGNVFHVTDYVNPEAFLVARNDESNAWSPGLWSRFDWTWFDGSLYYCQTAYDAASEAAAYGVAPPDASDPATTGCGGFAWTRLSP